MTEPNLIEFQIETAKRLVTIRAQSARHAKVLFQERFGYWPDDKLVTPVVSETTNIKQINS